MAVIVLGGLLTSLALNMVVVPVLFMRYGLPPDRSAPSAERTAPESLEPAPAGARS